MFFDIDGTLLSEKTKAVPESAVRAVAQARKEGHLTFINSGRTYCLMGPIRELVEMDGYLCGCGTDLTVEGEQLFRRQIPHERGLQIRKDILKYGLDGWLEAREAIYFRKETSRFAGIEQVRQSVHRNVSDYGWDEECFDYDKLCVFADEQSDRDGFFRIMEEDFEIIDRDGLFYEIVPKGYSKATAIERVLEHYGLALDDAYVFGDSTNDLPMFQYAKHSVLMGNHSKELEPYATFVTKTVEEDGIAWAMTELGLIPRT